MINKRVGVVIAVTFISLLIIIPVLFKHKKPVQQATIVTGLTAGQQKTFQQDLSSVLKQYGYIQKGDKLLARGRVDEAIKEYETALSLARSSGARGEAFRELAGAYEKKRDYEKALEYISIVKDKYIADWAKEPLVERAKYLEYASKGEYDLAVEHAEKAVSADEKVHDSNITKQDYQNRLNDLIAAKDYILSLRE